MPVSTHAHASALCGGSSACVPVLLSFKPSASFFQDGDTRSPVPPMLQHGALQILTAGLSSRPWGFCSIGGTVGDLAA
jgi:hypothetical protein